MSQLIIASAANFETEPLVDFLQDHNVHFTQITTGIGWTESAIVSSQTRSLVLDRDVVFVGTGGIIGPFQNPELFSVQSVSVSPYDIRNGSSELLTAFDKCIVLKPLDIELPFANAVSSLGITVGTEVHTSNHPCTIENIELYCVARAWNQCCKSFTSFIATTNATGGLSRVHWKLNYHQAAQLTAKLVGPILLDRYRLKG